MQSLKVAVLEPAPHGLVAALARLAGRPRVRRFADLYDDHDALRAWQPDALAFDATRLDDADLGALRLLRRALPRTVFAGFAPLDREVEVQERLAPLDGRVLVTPFSAADLAALLAAARAPGSRPGPEAFRELLRGISDEVNNPLLFAKGHLQLLEAALDPHEQSTAAAQVRAIGAALDRIAATMRKLRLLDDAVHRRHATAPVELAAVLAEALEATDAEHSDAAERATALEVSVAEDATSATVAVDRRLLREALRHLVGTARALASRAEHAALRLERRAGEIGIGLELRGAPLEGWRLPRAFEPYYLARAMRGSSFGLGLFIVQTIVHAHGGRAVALRRLDGTVVFDLALPTV